MEQEMMQETAQQEIWDETRNFDMARDVAAALDFSTVKHKDAEGRPVFTITNLTDIHYSSDRTEEDLAEVYRRVKAFLQLTDPDLITITGDFVSYNSDMETHMPVLAGMIDSLNIPWAPILGNHEGFTAEKREAAGRAYLRHGYRNIIFRMNDGKLGVGNYLINITDKGRVVRTLFMVDSHTDYLYPSGEKDYEFIWPEQFKWYQWAVEGIKKANGECKSFCLLHIPPVEAYDAFLLYQQGKLHGIHDNNEIICVPGHELKAGPYNNGFFDHVRGLGTDLVLYGHDHTNSAVIEYKGVTLAYAACSKVTRPCNGLYTIGSTLTIAQEGNFALEHYAYEDGFRKMKDLSFGKYAKQGLQENAPV